MTRTREENAADMASEEATRPSGKYIVSNTVPVFVTFYSEIDADTEDGAMETYDEGGGNCLGHSLGDSLDGATERLDAAPAARFNPSAVYYPEPSAGIDNDPAATAPFPAIFSHAQISVMQDALRMFADAARNMPGNFATAIESEDLAERLEAMRRPAPDPVTMAAAAVLHLKAARECLKAAGSTRTLPRAAEYRTSDARAEGKAVRP